MSYLKKAGVAAGLSIAFLLAGCSDSGSKEESKEPSKAVNYEITGIEAGSGAFKAAERALDDYDNLKGWEVQASSSGAMTTALGGAIDRKKPIIITGWSPHWMFAKYDLHYLEDPKKSFGDEQRISTIVKKGLQKEQPDAYKILDAFKWKTKDMEDVMLHIADGKDPEKAAAEWVETNKDVVAEWTKGTKKGNGKKIELGYVEWDTEVASTNVVKKVLEDQGFDVKITPLDMSVLWEAVAKGEIDGMVSAWLPTSQGDLLKAHKDQVEDLGANLEGVKIGLVVPDYMDIKSIEDLKPKK